MDTPDEPTADLFDSSGEIISDVICRRCGYNLRGLREAGRCPECGTPIGLSTHGDLLRFADPAWVEKLALGIKYMLWGILVAVVVGILASCLASWLRPGGGAFQQAIGGIAGLLGLYGAWLLTAPDPSRIGEDRYVTARKVVRFGLIIGLANHAIMAGIQASPALSKQVVIFLVIPAVACGLVGVGAEFAKFMYIEKLAGRIPDRKLASLARFLRWAYSIGLAAMVVYGGLMLVGLVTTTGGTMAGLMTAATASAPASSPATGPGMTGMTVAVPVGPAGGLVALLIGGACLFGLATLVFMIMVLVLYVRLGRRFREQADIARTTWATATAARSGSTGPDDTQAG